MIPRHRVDGPASAPPLVLSSSLGTTMEMWDAQLPALTERFRVVRYDHRGHGGSEPGSGSCTMQSLAADVVELLDALEIERASFCGLSIGGAVGMALALAAPERVDRLVLACTSARFGEPDYWHERARVVREQGTAAVADAVVARWFTPDMPQHVVARFRQTLEAMPREPYARCCEALASWDARARLGEIRPPTLVIAGEADASTPIVHAELLAQGIGAPLVAIERAAHLANVERPVQFNRAILELPA